MLIRRRFLTRTLGGAGAFSAAMALPGCAEPAGAGSVMALRIDTASPGPVIAPAFLGFSYEKSAISKPLFAASNADLIRMFRALGRGVFRIGGNSVDKTSWEKDGPGGQAAFVARPDIDRLAGFIRATGWTIIYAVNMGSSSPEVAADEVAYAVRAFGPDLLGLEIGNEPDVYRHNGLRPASYTYAQFQGEWQEFASAIRARSPGVGLTGPASAFDIKGYTLPFAADHGAQIAQLTQHYYRADGKKASSTVDLLLTRDGRLPGMLADMARACASAGIKGGFRLAEANSYYNGGAPNVSNSFGGALWLLDYLAALAEGGAAGVNLHGGGNWTGYTPIADNGRVATEARPEYAAMLLFARLAGGRVLASSLPAAGMALTSLAVAQPGGEVMVLLVNRERGRAARISLPGRGCVLTRLVAPSPDTPSGVTLGGAPVTPDGRWSAPGEALQAGPGGLVVELPAASAALAVLRG